MRRRRPRLPGVRPERLPDGVGSRPVRRPAPAAAVGTPGVGHAERDAVQERGLTAGRAVRRMAGPAEPHARADAADQHAPGGLPRADAADQPRRGDAVACRLPAAGLPAHPEDDPAVRPRARPPLAGAQRQRGRDLGQDAGALQRLRLPHQRHLAAI
ncbi:hypothetical protein SBRY_50762 [Actinacidiphila bryophytorum]|uniref:Uncharacterized protein n=1 Tax=Actinacidiphila bryophytorum TaxID=1436133 RepID=A0A9W4H513_9ACTN|nr:hypothetical protein SBRY_50762 [Actinacidiphila bryophytorum]